MNKDIRACLPLDKAIPFGSIEPFDGSSCSFRHFTPFISFARRKAQPALIEKAPRVVIVWVLIFFDRTRFLLHPTLIA
jgi:hypothetical protein